MTLKADIKYKSNWQQGALKGKSVFQCIISWVDRPTGQRRNKWICALKLSMAKVKMFGPSGDPDSKPSPQPVTMVPWEEVQREQHAEVRRHPESQESISQSYSFTDKNAVMRMS